MRSLALVAEVVHGAPCRFADPARFSMAHGGKDRHPYPVPLDVYDRTIDVMKTAVSQARLGNEEKLDAIKRLDRQARRLAQTAARAGPAGVHRTGTPRFTGLWRTQRIRPGNAGAGRAGR